MSTREGTKRRYLFIHQNFPGQFVHLAAALARQGHEVVALGIEERTAPPGVKYVRYKLDVPNTPSTVPLVRDIEVKVIRGSACAAAMVKLRQGGFEPDLVIAHPGWGEALFCKDVWPAAKLLVFAEFFYNADGADYNFDSEFSRDTPSTRSALRVKNTILLHALHACDWAYVPTQWQFSQLPSEYRHKVDVIFDGINTQMVKPDASARFRVPQSELTLTSRDEVLTFVNRSPEPYRGFHTFMRALPEILASRPGAHCVIVGRDDVSYGQKPRQGGTWREAMLKEVGDRLPLDRVHFVGSLPYTDYLKVLQISTCHVYLTYPFVLGWSCVEALSAGCTLVGSDTGPVREVIEHSKTGVLTDFFDARALAGRVIEVMQNPKAFRPLGAAARAQVVERYDLGAVCLPRQLAMIDKLLRSNP